MLRGAALLTALLLAFLAADGVRAGSPTTDWFNVTNTTLKTVPGVRICVWRENEPKRTVAHR